ncbi:MAG: phosphotransferase [Firmicutes bacterium]|nr:phosphotransferase [Bacillota bacterium]
MQLGRLIGTGRTAEVYQSGEDRVLKLFHPHIPRHWVDYEARIGSLLYSAGVPAPRVDGCVEIGDRAGIIYERIDGTTLQEHLLDRPEEVILYAKRMAALHYQIHSSTCRELPPQRTRFSTAIIKAADILGDSKVITILSYINRLPNPFRVCHGDFHPANLMLGKDIVPIDWMNAYSGSPAGDVARTCLMLRSPHVPEELSILDHEELTHLKKVIHDVYLEEYLHLSGADPFEIEAWFLPVMAARLREKVPGEREWLLAEIDKRLRSLGSN